MKIRLENVSKRFDRVAALDDVTLEFQPGEIVALLGANGAGKTTLIRCLAGIAAPDRGRVLFDGETFSRDKLHLRRALYFMPDYPPFLWQHSIMRNIATVLRLYEADLPGSEARVVELLADFDLLPLAGRAMHTLSRGQYYKAGLVAMIAADRAAWVLDEPFASGMDPHGIDAFRRHAREAARRGRTIIYSTQLLDVAEKFSDRACLIHRGAIHAFDTLANLRAAAADKDNVLEDMFRQLRESAT